MAQGTVNASLISSVDYLQQREIFNQLVDVTNEEISLMEMLLMLGRYEQTKQTTYHNFTNRLLFNSELVQTYTDTSTNGTQVTLKLTGANGRSQGVVGKIVVFPNGFQGRIRSRTNHPTGDLILVDVVNPNELLNASGVNPAGLEVTFLTNAQGEASDIPEPEYRLVDKQQNQTQIFRNYGEITDVQDVSAIEIMLGGNPYIFYKIQHDTLRKHEGEISHALFMSRESDPNFGSQAPTLTDADGSPVQTTRGLNQEIELNGMAFPGTVINGAFWDNIARELAATRAPRDYTIYGGIEANIQWTNFFQALSSVNRVSDVARFSVDGRRLDLGIDAVNYHGYQFAFKQMECLNNTETLGNAQSTVRKAMFFVPEGKVETEYGSGSVDRMRLRYFPLRGGTSSNGIHREFMNGKLAPTPTNGKQVLGIDVDTHCGLEVLGANFFGKATLA